MLAAVCLLALSRLPVEPGLGLLWQLPALLVMWFLYGSVLVGFFLIGHDAQHRSFSRTGWVNRFVGYLCLAPLFNGAHTWKLTHDHHHQWTQLLGQDVDWAANLVTRERFEQLTWRRDLAIKLERAGDAIRAAYPAHYREVPLTWREMAWVRWAPFLALNPEKGYYEMSFRAADREAPSRPA